MTVFAVDAHLLWQVVWVSTLASLAMSALLSLVIVGGARASDARRTGRSGAAALYAALAFVAFALVAVGVVLGVQAMITR